MVTGAASGIGLAAAQGFASLGATVLAVARNEQRARDAEQAMSGDVRGVACDVSSVAALRELAAGVERLDVLVNNAGVMPRRALALRRRRGADLRHARARPVRADPGAGAGAGGQRAGARDQRHLRRDVHPGAAPRRPHVRARRLQPEDVLRALQARRGRADRAARDAAWPARASSSTRCTRAGPTPPASSTRCRCSARSPGRSCATTRRARTRSSGSAPPPEPLQSTGKLWMDRARAADALPLRRLAGRGRGARGAVEAVRAAR